MPFPTAAEEAVYNLVFIIAFSSLKSLTSCLLPLDRTSTCPCGICHLVQPLLATCCALRLDPTPLSPMENLLHTFVYSMRLSCPHRQELWSIHLGDLPCLKMAWHIVSTETYLLRESLSLIPASTGLKLLEGRACAPPCLQRQLGLGSYWMNSSVVRSLYHTGLLRSELMSMRVCPQGPQAWHM